MKKAVSLEALALFRALKDDKSKFAQDCRQIVLSETPELLLGPKQSSLLAR
jgi:hypothetical protein